MIETDLTAASPTSVDRATPFTARRAVRRTATVHRPARVAALDGLRGLAIAGVVAFHADVFDGGFLGVDLFFVLSGYLITGLLAKEQIEHGRIALLQFWTRRARRLVPAVLFLLAAVQLWVRYNDLPGQLRTINGQTLAALVYGSNWYNIFAEIGYWDAGVERSPLNHLWSLAIEEQYYVVFPFLMMLMLGHRRAISRALPAVMLLLAIAALVLTPVLFANYGADRAYFGTDTRAGALLLGATLALVGAGRTLGHTGDDSARRRAMALSLGAGGLAVLAVMWSFASTKAPWLYQGGLAVHGLAATAVLGALMLDPAGPLTRVMSWRPLVWLGERSYSLYLWHWPVMVILTAERTGLTGLPLVLLNGAVIATGTLISYQLVENPIRYSSLAGMRLVGAMTVPAIALAVSAHWFQPPAPPQFGTNTLQTEGRGGLRLLIAGDSWARSIGIGMVNADSARRTTILNLGKGGCGIAIAVRERSAENTDRALPPDCRIWETKWPASIRTFRPNATILTVGNWDQVSKDFDGSGVFVGPCDARFQASYAAQLDKAILLLSEGNTPVFVTTVYDNGGIIGSAPDCMNQMLRAAVTRNASRGVHLLDLYAQLCLAHQCPSRVNGRGIYTETWHLADEAERRIGLWVLNSVYDKVPVPKSATGS